MLRRLVFTVLASASAARMSAAPAQAYPRRSRPTSTLCSTASH